MKKAHWSFLNWVKSTVCTPVFKRVRRGAGDSVSNRQVTLFSLLASFPSPSPPFLSSSLTSSSPSETSSLSTSVQLELTFFLFLVLGLFYLPRAPSVCHFFLSALTLIFFLCLHIFSLFFRLISAVIVLLLLSLKNSSVTSFFSPDETSS